MRQNYEPEPPQSRVEKLLYNLIGPVLNDDSASLEPPQSRVEELIQTLTETVLGENALDLEPPQSRVEKLLYNLVRAVETETVTSSLYVNETSSGNIVSFTDGADAAPVEDLVVHIEPVQSGTGDPSPDNVRPISGWTEANVTVNEDVLDITFPTEAGTVYGGTLDVTSGVLTVDRAMVVNSQKASKYENENGYYWYTTTRELYAPEIKGLNAKLVSNRFKPSNVIAVISPEGVITFYANNIIRWKEQGSLTASEYKSYLASNPLQICYELATPITYQLTPQEVRTLLGQNNIFADTGDVDVTYRADTKLYIQKLVEAND